MNIFIHRRDMRLQDNTTLIEMSKNMKNINPIFIFTPEQIKKNKYFSNNLVQFMCETLLDLKEQYINKASNLHFYYGDIIDVLESIHKKTPIKNLGFNLDYSPYSKKRDNKIEKWCKKNNIKLWKNEDMLLVNIINNKNYPNETPYKVFTPYMRYQISNYNVNIPTKRQLNLGNNNISTNLSINNDYLKKFYKLNMNLLSNGGKEEAQKKLKNLSKQDKYNTMRDSLNYETSRLSPYINLGLLSIREVYHHIKNKFNEKHSLITELYWRDFYYNILYHYPHVVGNSFKDNYDNIKWENNKSKFNKWCKGETGFPIVDACMKEMNTTGYMHNRGRMIVSSFLTKDLMIDWRWGEKYFATQLLVYNISSNNGGWQWAAGTGTDAQPYFRIFNPWTQSAKFDSECKYIKKWLPELDDVSNKDIHKRNIKYQNYKNINYPKPIVDHDEQRKKALEKYQQYL